MKIKTFNVNEENKVNEFIESVVLLDEGAVQVTSENTIVVFYKETKEKYQDHFVLEMIEQLNRNLFHEKIRLHALNAEVETYKEKGGKSEDFDSAIKRQKEARDNVRMFEAKISSLEAWKK